VQSEKSVASEDPDFLDSQYGATDELEDWAQEAVPSSLKIPKNRTVAVLRFKSEWTDARDGDRTCVLWNLSVGDEKLANQRGGDNSRVVLMELAKQQIRAIDGKVIDHTGRTRDANIDVWWNAIGHKCRSLIYSHFVRAHNLSTEERLDFLANCVAVRTFSAGG